MRFARVLFSIAVGCLVQSANAVSTITVDITANIDGRDQLIVQGGTLQWQHFDWTPVGLHNSSFPSTIITTTVDGVVVLDAFAWTPTWPNGTGSGAFSSKFEGLLPQIPAAPLGVSLIVEQARYEITLVQLPSMTNGYATVVEFNDNPPNSDANYQAKMIFSVPEPSTMAMLSVGLCIFAMNVRRMRERRAVGGAAA